MFRYKPSLNSCNGSPMEKLTYTVTEVAKLLGIGRSAAYEAARNGQIPTVRIGKRILVPAAGLQRMLDGKERPALDEGRQER